MKRFVLLAFSIGILPWSSVLQAQTVHTVDNNAGSVAEYSNLQTAIIEAATGDTILIAGSPNYYGLLNVYKELHFVGVGYYLATNSVPGLSTNASAVVLRFKNDISLGNSTGSSVSGLSGFLVSEAGVTLTVDKCYDAGNTWNFNGPVTITRSSSRNAITIRESSTSASISNSVIYSLNMLGTNQSATNCIIRHEIYTVPSQNVTNCILLAAVTGTRLDLEADFTYCMKIGGGGLPTGDGTNVNNVLLTDVFTGAGGDQAIDRCYVLKDGSPAIGAGLLNEDMGIFGGDNPYVLSGVPGRPRLTRFDIPPTATGLTDLTFEVESQAFAE